tara:strand:+ start:34194 stop:34892 length:699 start_codon:yes stop_codon:yes gene_type:complete
LISLKNKTIYHLDDDPEVLTLVKIACQKRLGIEYKEFTTAESFLTALKQKTPDLCIIDLNLKESAGAGFMVTKAIRNRDIGKMPIIVMSRRSYAKDISLALESGASDFLPKPVDFDLLTEKITFLLKGAETNSFPMHKIKNPISANLEIHLRPLMVDEAYLYVSSKFFVLKNTKLIVKHTIVKKIFDEPSKEFVVHNCELESHDGSYTLKLIPKDPSDEYFEKIHRFLLLMS